MASVEKVSRTRYLLGGRQVPRGTPGAQKVTELSKDYYAVIYDGRGKRVRIRMRGVTNRVDAERRCRLLMDRVERQEQEEYNGTDLDVSRLLEKYRERMLGRGLTSRTVRDEMSKVREILIEVLNVVRLNDIKISQIQEELQKKTTRNQWRQVKPLSARTKNFYIGALNRFGKWLWKEKYWKKNLFRRLEKFRGTVVKVRRYMTPEELKAIVQAARNRGRSEPELELGRERALFYLFLFYTLSRAESSRSVAVSQLNFRKDPPELVLRGDQVKNRKPVTKVLHPLLVGELKRWIARRRLKADDVLFPNISPWVVAQFNRDLKAAGIQKNLSDGTSLDIHSFKTSAISILHDAGVPLKVIQELAEHSSPQTTMNHYVKANKVTLAQAFLHLPTLD